MLKNERDRHLANFKSNLLISIRDFLNISFSWNKYRNEIINSSKKWTFQKKKTDKKKFVMI